MFSRALNYFNRSISTRSHAHKLTEIPSALQIILDRSMSCKQSKRPPSSSATGTAMTASKKKAKQSPIPQSKVLPVWLVFVEEETGASGYQGGMDYDNGSHSATLAGIYTSKNEADKHADSLRRDDDDDSDADADDKSTSRSVTVVESPVKNKFYAKQKKGYLWRFDADTDIPAHQGY